MKSNIFSPIKIEEQILKELGYTYQGELGYTYQGYTWGEKVYGWYLNDKLCTEADAVNALKEYYKKNKSNTLKVFVWNDFFPDSAGSMAVAIAYTEREAYDFLLKKKGSHGIWNSKAKIYPLERGFAFATSGGC